MNSYWTRIGQIRLVYSELGGMLCPPATEQQIVRTEAKLGCRIPEMLRHYYRDLANGGFGPPWGIVGVEGGYNGSIGDIGSALGNLFDWDDSREEGELSKESEIIVSTNHRKFKIVTHVVIVDHGCGSFDEMRISNGTMYRTDVVDEGTISIRLIAETIDEYLDIWLSQVDESYQASYKQIKFLHDHLGEVKARKPLL